MMRNPGPPPEWPLRFVERIAKTIEDLTDSIRHADQTSIHNTSQIMKALEQHTDALIKSTEASDRFANNLVKATWGLVGVTAALVAVGIIQIIVLLTE